MNADAMDRKMLEYLTSANGDSVKSLNFQIKVQEVTEDCSSVFGHSGSGSFQCGSYCLI